MKRVCSLIWLCLCSVALMGAEAEPWTTPAEAQIAAEELRKFFDGAAVRYVGSEGNKKIEQKVGELFGKCAADFRGSDGAGAKSGTIQFQAPAFRPGKTVLAIEGQAPLRVHTLHPTVMRPGNFLQKRFECELVWLGKGDVVDLEAAKGLRLDGAIAVMDFDCMANWARLLRFGIQGILFIDGARHEYLESLNKIYVSEVAVPRFFVGGEEAQALRKLLQGKRSVKASVEAEPSRWENTTLRNHWLFMPGANKDVSKDVCVLVAPIDSNCVVPELGEGAQSGSNLYLLTRLAESFRQEPPQRSVLLVAVNAHTQCFLGERMLAWHLLVSTDDVEGVRDSIADSIKEQKVYSDYFKQLDDLLADAARSDEAEALLIKLREHIDKESGKNVTIKKPLVKRVKSELNSTKSRQLLIQRKLQKGQLSQDQTQQLQQELQQLTVQREKYVKVLTLFNRWGNTTKLSQLAAEQRQLLVQYVRTELKKNLRFAELNKADVDINQANNAVRMALEGRSVKWVLNLDLTWRGPKLGLSSGEFWGNSEWRYKWGVNVADAASKMPALAQGRENPFLDTMSFHGSLPEGYYFPSAIATQFFHGAAWTPAFSLMNAHTQEGRAFTVGDTFASLSPRIFADTLVYVPQLLRTILSVDTATLKPRKLKQGLWTIQLRTLKFDEFSSAVMPEDEVTESCVTLRQPGTSASPVLHGDVVSSYTALTDERGVATLYGIRDWNALSTTALKLDADFTIVNHAIDAGERERSLSSNVERRANQIIVMFACKELPIYARENPALISVNPITISTFDPLDSKRESNPRMFGVAGCRSSMSQKVMDVMTTPWAPAALYNDFRQPLKVLAPTTMANTNSAVALNTVKDAEGQGYLQPGEVGPDLIAVSAKDMSALNKYRLNRLRGVSQELAQLFLNKGDKALQQLETAKSSQDHVGYLQAVYAAIGAEFQAYSQIGGLSNDMLRAVVFYMALILPFCFFLQKLVFNIVKVEFQILLFIGLFLLCYLAFRQLHPAFEIAKSPEGILIAFVMGALGAFVIKILHGRFEGEMQLLFRSYSGIDTQEIGYSTVGQKAMLIGVNNMRRRRVRTLLTTATIVLVTFTMLSFTSISQKMSPTVVTISNEPPPYTGLMYHWPGKCMDESTMQVFREMFHGRADVLVRRWLRPPTQGRETLAFRLSVDTGKEAQIKAGLGMGVQEDGFLDKMPLVAGRFFSSDSADEMVIPASLAETLGIDVQKFSEHKANLRGVELLIVGVISDERFRVLKDLDWMELSPQKEGAASADKDSAAVPSVSDAAREQTGLFVDTNALVLVPVDRLAQMGALPYSVSVRFKGKIDLWQETNNLLTVGTPKFYIASQETFFANEDASDPKAAQSSTPKEMRAGTYYIGSSFRTSTGNLASLIIPLLISGTIILNTMLGSVFERKKEIAIYNAIGLNPNHIGMFFLSEAFVYSVIGSVGGYMIGQGLSILIQHWGVEGVDVNFSSLKVVYVILFTVGMVLLSTLYPAYVATRAAVPSGKRKWSFPAHDGQQMRVMFPFIYRPDVVAGVTTYLEEYFARFTEASVGDLIATLERKGKGQDSSGREVYSMEYHLALAPFDLGVTQKVIFEFKYNERVQSYDIAMLNIRISGQDTNWVTTNKPFLERLRTYLMHWRNLDAGQQALYAEAASKSFATETAAASV